MAGDVEDHVLLPNGKGRATEDQPWGGDQRVGGAAWRQVGEVWTGSPQIPTGEFDFGGTRVMECLASGGAWVALCLGASLQ